MKAKKLLSGIMTAALVLTAGVIPSSAKEAGTIFYDFHEITSPSELVNGESYAFLSKTYSGKEAVVEFPEGSAMLNIESTISGNKTTATISDTCYEYGFSYLFPEGDRTQEIEGPGRDVLDAIVKVDIFGTGFDTCYYGGIHYMDNESYKKWEYEYDGEWKEDLVTVGPTSGWAYACYYHWAEEWRYNDEQTEIYYLSDPLHAYTYKEAEFTEDDIEAYMRTGYSHPTSPKKVTPEEVVVVITLDGKQYDVPFFEISEENDELGGDDKTIDVVVGDVVKTVTVKEARPVESGDVEEDVEKEEGNFGGAGFNNTVEELKDIVLTDEEKAAVDNGEKIKVWLEVTDITETVSAEDKALVEAAKPDDYTIGTYIDVNLFKKVGDNDQVKVKKLPNGKVSITITIPEALRKDGREYKMIKLHEGESEVLSTTFDAETFSITFETGEFSTYAIAYTDETVSPKTSQLSMTLAIIMIALIGGVGIVEANKRRTDK